MAESARILAAESMAEARSALADFAQAVEGTLSEVDADIQRMTQWLQHDRTAHWKREVRLRHDEVLRAKTALARKELIAAPERAGVVEERKAVERAKRRLDEAQKRQAATRRWAAVWEREAMAYKSPAHQLRDMVSSTIPAALTRIARMMESVEAYLSLAPPVGEAGPALPDSAEDLGQAPEGQP